MPESARCEKIHSGDPSAMPPAAVLARHQPAPNVTSTGAYPPLASGHRHLAAHHYYNDSLSLYEKKFLGVTDSKPHSAVVWMKHVGKNCWWDGHGAEEVDTQAYLEANPPPQTPGIFACREWCLQEPRCEAVVWGGPQMCYRKRNIELSRCSNQGKWETHMLTQSFPPAPPLPSPAPRAPFPPVPPGHSSKVMELNARFTNGRFSNNLKEAGVIIHQFDAMEDPNPDGEPWVPGVGRWDTGDRISAAMVYKNMVKDPGGHISVYSWDLAGYILNPDYNELWCAFPYDVGSLRFTCYPRGKSDHCTPGCNRMNWCQDFTSIDSDCPWPPDQLAMAMEQRDMASVRGWKPMAKMWDDGKFYSELIFNADHFIEHLPHAIEAFFYISENCEMGKSDVYDGPKCGDYAKGAHANYLRHFNLSAEEVPLVHFDLWNWEMPFEQKFY